MKERYEFRKRTVNLYFHFHKMVIKIKSPKAKKSPRQIPSPSGPYKVGCTDIMTPGLENGVFFRLFYPAVPVMVSDI